MRLGGPVHEACVDPQQWVEALRRLNYGAAYCPVNDDADAATVSAYAAAAEQAGIVIAEVGAWSNPLGPDAQAARQALELCIRRLGLAEAIGARCCVNISGSRGEPWDGPHLLNLTAETFDRVVQVVRQIIDAVSPTRTSYTLETMPWMYPDSADSYLRLVRAIDRPAFAVHFDPVNLICSPQLFYGNAAMIRDFVTRLGPMIKSVHVKDVALSQRLTVHIDEVLAGTGGLDHAALFRALRDLGPDLPVMLEHLPTPAEYTKAAGYVRAAALKEGVEFVAPV